MSTKKSTGSNFAQYKWSDFITDVVSQPSFLMLKLVFNMKQTKKLELELEKKYLVNIQLNNLLYLLNFKILELYQ
jgi:hypothetical protein